MQNPPFGSAASQNPPLGSAASQNPPLGSAASQNLPFGSTASRNLSFDFTTSSQNLSFGFAAPRPTQPFLLRPSVKRAGTTGPGSPDPDPNGDITLVISPPERSPKYREISQSKRDATGNSKTFKVSSKHLTLGSAYFKNRLSAQWPEGQDLAANGSTTLEISDTYPEAFSVLMNIFHCHKGVPRNVDLEMLTDIAVMTDYFQCHEALGPYPLLWLEGLKNKVPSEYSNDIVKWIFISWVFNYDDIFRAVTQTAQRKSPKNIDTLDLLIPASAHSTINETRSTAISNILEALKKRRRQLEDNRPCSHTCNCLLLGALIIETKTLGLSMDAAHPYTGLAVENTVNMILQSKAPVNSCRKGFGPPCSLLDNTARNEISHSLSSLKGLDLS